MRYIILGLIAAMLMAVSCVSEQSIDITTDGGANNESVYASGEVLVKFTPEVAAIVEQTGLVRSEQTRSGVPSVDELIEIIGGCELSRVFPVDERYEERTKRDGLHCWYRVRFDGNYTVEEVSRRFALLGEVQKVDMNRRVKRANTSKAIPLSMEAYERLQQATRADAKFNDPLLSKQWGLVNDGTMLKSVKDADVQAVGAWEKSKGDSSVVVAVLDEGVYVDHPDLKANIWINENEIDRSTGDNDDNGYAGDYHGYNFVHDTGVITWNDYYDSGHGSHVSGLIAAVNNNGVGISSIAGGDGSADSGVKIMVCQIFSGNMSTGILNVVRAIKYAADNGAVVLQCSWGYVSGAANIYDWGEQGFASEEVWSTASPLEKEALDYFTHNAGSPNGIIEGGIAVYAAGNESAPMAGFPGAAKDYISVASIAADFTPAVYTNYGPGTTISAPGGDQDYYYEDVNEQTGRRGEIGCMLSAVPYHISESGYAFMEGTSMATPMVSGVIALGLSYATKLRRHFRAEELRDLLYSTATNIDAYFVGTKLYNRYVADIGAIQPVQMSLAPYRGQMGYGLVNATALLNAIEGAGVEMHFPNLTIEVDGTTTTSPALYFVGGEELTYEVTIADTAIATCEKLGAKLVFKGLKSGTTKATIKSSNSISHEFNITVRKSNGWL